MSQHSAAYVPRPDRDDIRDDIIFELSHIGVDDDGMVIRVVAAYDERVAGLVTKLTAARLAEEFAKDSLAVERKLRKQAEAELAAALGSRSCETCLYWTRHTYDDEGLCESTITYKPDWAEDDDPPRTVEALALWGSNGEYGFNPPADFGCNRWAARAEEGGGE